eukprot:2827607-Pyramimonas_sp.AAC.1
MVKEAWADYLWTREHWDHFTWEPTTQGKLRGRPEMAPGQVAIDFLRSPPAHKRQPAGTPAPPVSASPIGQRKS